MNIKYINRADFIDYCKKQGVQIQYKGSTNKQYFTIEDLIANYDKYITNRDVKDRLKRIIRKEIDIYTNSPQMTKTALTEHIVDKLTSYDGLALFKLIGEDTE